MAGSNRFFRVVQGPALVGDDKNFFGDNLKIVGDDQNNFLEYKLKVVKWWNQILWKWFEVVGEDENKFIEDELKVTGDDEDNFI